MPDLGWSGANGEDYRLGPYGGKTSTQLPADALLRHVTRALHSVRECPEECVSGWSGADLPPGPDAGPPETARSYS